MDAFVRCLVTAAQVATVAGILMLMLSFCSCSSSRRTAVASADSAAHATAARLSLDSVSAGVYSRDSVSGSVEIENIRLFFGAPMDSISTDSGRYAPASADALPDHAVAQPSALFIDRLKITSDLQSESSAAADSVSKSAAADASSQSCSQSSAEEKKPPAVNIPMAMSVFLFIVMAIAVAAFLSRSLKSRT